MVMAGTKYVDIEEKERDESFKCELNDIAPDHRL